MLPLLCCLLMGACLLLAVMRRYKNQNVAIKVMHKGDTSEELAKREARFAREVTLLARVQHKNLVKVSST